MCVEEGTGAHATGIWRVEMRLKTLQHTAAPQTHRPAPDVNGAAVEKRWCKGTGSELSCFGQVMASWGQFLVRKMRRLPIRLDYCANWESGFL